MIIIQILNAMKCYTIYANYHETAHNTVFSSQSLKYRNSYYSLLVLTILYLIQVSKEIFALIYAFLPTQFFITAIYRYIE
jgi:hypothetical protein